MKSNVKFLAFSIVLLAAFSSCVPTKKWKDAEARNAACELRKSELMMQVNQLAVDSTEYGKRYRILERQKRELEATTSSELQKLNDNLKTKEAELNKKEGMLSDREKTVRDLQAAIARKDSLVTALRNKVADALVGFPKDQLSVEMRDGKVYVSLSDKLLFKSGSTIVDPAGQDALKKLGEVLAKNSEIDVQIEGHTDNVPIKTARFDDNWDLSVLRGTSVTRILLASGVDVKRITPSGKGEFSPVAPNDSVEGKSRNRRTEIILSPKLDELFRLLESGS